MCNKFYFNVHLTGGKLKHRILSELIKISRISLLRCSYAKESTIEKYFLQALMKRLLLHNN